MPQSLGAEEGRTWKTSTPHATWGGWQHLLLCVHVGAPQSTVFLWSKAPHTCFLLRQCGSALLLMRDCSTISIMFPHETETIITLRHLEISFCAVLLGTYNVDTSRVLKGELFWSLEKKEDEFTPCSSGAAHRIAQFPTPHFRNVGLAAIPEPRHRTSKQYLQAFNKQWQSPK